MVPWMSGLVSGLQNHVRQFESARHLFKTKRVLHWYCIEKGSIADKAIEPFFFIRNRYHQIYFPEIYHGTNG